MIEISNDDEKNNDDDANHGCDDQVNPIENESETAQNVIYNDVNPDSIQEDISTFVWSSLQLKAVYPMHYEYHDSPPQSMISESIIGYDDDLSYYQLVAIPSFNSRPRRFHLVDDCLCNKYEQYKYINQVAYANDNLIALPTQIHDYFDGTGWITEFRFLPFLTLYVCFR